MAEMHENFTVISEHDFDSDNRNGDECQQTKARALESADPTECSYIDHVYITNELADVESFHVSNVCTSNQQSVSTKYAIATDSSSPEVVSISVSEADPPITPFSPTEPVTPIPPPTPSTPTGKEIGLRYNWDDSAFEPVIPVRCKNTSGYLHKARFGSGTLAVLRCAKPPISHLTGRL